VSASQGATPRTGTMSSRDLRAARAARSARSTSPAKPRSSTLKNGTRAPPLQTRSLQTFQMSQDDLASGRAAREARQHTLPSVNRKKSQQASAESRKSAVDDFHCEYDYVRQGSDKLATVTPDDAINEDFAMYRRDNLSQDSYRVSDSRDSSVDRLEMRTKLDDEAEFIGAEPLDEAKLIQKLEQEQQLQESRNVEEQNAGDFDKLQQNEDVYTNDDEQAINDGEEVHIVKAEWDLPESCLQTEVEKIISIETTRVIETVETTRVTPVTDTYRRQKRLSRENAVRVVDEDMTSSPTDTVDMTDVPGPEFAVPVSTDQNGVENKGITDQEQIESFIVLLINDIVKKAAEEVRAALTVEETVTGEPSELTAAVMETTESVFSGTNDTESPTGEVQEKSLTVTAEDGSRDETFADGHFQPEDENELNGSKMFDVSEQNSEDTAESQITVVEVEASDTRQDTSAIDETSDELLVTTDHVVPEEAAQLSPTNVASPSRQVLETVELPNDRRTEDALTSDICADSVQPCTVADQQTEEAVAAGTDTASEEIQTAVNQILATKSETESQNIQEPTPVDSADVCEETVTESEQLPDEVVVLHKDAETVPATETSEDIPYVLHKRHITPAVEKTAGETRLYATLPSRHHPSRSRSLSPGHKRPVLLTSEQKRAQMMKVKASLVSMAAEMAALRSPKSPVGISAPTRRLFDFVVCSRLPPRDSFSSRDDTLSPPDEPDIALIPRGKKVSSAENKPADRSETESKQLLDITSFEDAEKTVCLESEPPTDVMEKASTSEPNQLIADSPSIEITALHEEVSMNIKEIEGTDTEKHTAEVEKLQTPEGLESESESESKPIGDEAATPELEDEVNRILSECELHVATEDNDSLASGVSGKFTDESPEVETSRGLEANLLSYVVSTEGAALADRTSVPSSLPVTEHSEAAVELHEKPLILSSPSIETDSGHVAESLPTETDVRSSVAVSSLQALESHELSTVDQSVNGVVTQSGEYQHDETDGSARGGFIAANNAAKLAAAEQRLLLELQANDLATDNISSSSHSLNDQLDAEVLQSFSSVPPAVDAACRLSESSVDGPAATCGFGRNVHLLDWLEEQAQLRGVSVSPHGAEGHPDSAISDEDGVEHAVFEDNLQDIFAALEAEVMANPFLVPITPQTSDMCVNAMTSERFSFEDDSSLGVLEASGGVVEGSCGVDAQHGKASALSDDESKQIGAVGIADVEGNVRRSQLSLSISSEGDVVVEHVDDLLDPLEVLEIESRALPPQLRSKPVCLSSDSDNLSDKFYEEEKLQDVGDVLDRVDESRRLSISNLDDDNHPLTAGVRRVPLASDTSSDFSGGPVCVEEEADAFASLEEADNSTTGIAKPRHSNSDDGDEDISSSSAIDSDPAAALGNFVEQVMLHQSAGSEVLDRDDQTTEREEPTELDSARQQLHPSDADDEDTALSEYTLTPSCETVAQEAQLTEVFELPQSSEAFADTAISDEDDVEQSIEDSLQDVFAALEAEAKRSSVPVTEQTSLIIGQDDFSDDEESPSDPVNVTVSCEQETKLHEAGASSAVSDVLLRNESGETLGVTDECISVKDSGQETVDADFDLNSSPADISKSSEAAALEEHRANSAEVNDENNAVELDHTAADLSEPILTTDIQDRRHDTFQNDTPEKTVQDDTVQRETNMKESDTAQTSRDSLVVTKETADSDTEGIIKTEISRATESLEVDSKSAEAVDTEDSVNENVTVETHSNDDERVDSSFTNTEECIVNESCESKSVKDTDIQVESVEVDAGCAADRTEPGASVELVTQAVERSDDISGVTDSTEQSQHVS